MNNESVSLRGTLQEVHGRMCCSAVQPVSAVWKIMQEVVVVVGAVVATLHLPLCRMHQRPVKTGHRVQGVRTVMSLPVFVSLH